MRDDEIFTTAASAGLSTGANPMAFGAPAGMLGAAATTKAGTAVEDESCLAQSESASQSDMTEGGQKRKRRGQVNDDASYRNQHSST
jgi:hypothetical protein